MSGTNSRNLSFLIVLLVLVTFIFSYAFLFGEFREPIYTGINELELDED